jgi:hypothetical protein
MSTDSSDQLVDAYEQLRKHFITPSIESPILNGLAVFIHKGMGTWMQVSALTESSGTTPKCYMPRTVSAQPEIIELLTTMALASCVGLHV